jgi:excinuclease ABC subunit C
VDRVYVPGAKNAIAVHTSPALQLLAYARDEAHRVSNAYRLKLGERRTLRSELDDIPGIGPKTRAKLLAALGSMKGVREASLEELTGAGATQRQANAILTALGSRPAPPANISAAERDAVDHAFDAAEDAGADE